MASEERLVADLKRTVRTYVVIWRAATKLIPSTADVAGNEQAMAAAVLAAFAFEAYLNHVGAILFCSWTTVERGGLESLSWEGKLALIVEQLGVPLDRGAMPYQALSQLFKFRNDLAHGKTGTKETTGLAVDDFAETLQRGFEDLFEQEPLQLRWETWCDARLVERWMAAAKATIEAIHRVFHVHPRVPRQLTPEGRDAPIEPEDPFSIRVHAQASIRVEKCGDNEVD